VRRLRAGLYGCLTRRADALFELADTLVAGHALATAPPPHLSLEPAFRRGWGSTYGALRRGRIAEAAVRELLAATRRPPGRASSRSTHRAGRAAMPSAARSAATTITRRATRTASRSWPAGTTAGSPNSTGRLTPGRTARRAAHPAERGRRAGHRPARWRPSSAGSGPTERCRSSSSMPATTRSPSRSDLARVRAQILVRIRSDRVFFPDPAARPAGMRGDPAATGSASPAPTQRAGRLPARRSAPPTLATVGSRCRLERAPPPPRAARPWAGDDEPPIVAGSVIRVAVEHLPRPTAGR